MNPTTNSIDRSADPEPARPEVWVREKGLPGICHRSLCDRLGRRMHAAASRGASSIVVGDHAWRDWENAGCVCGHVTAHSPCTVLIVHAPMGT